MISYARTDGIGHLDSHGQGIVGVVAGIGDYVTVTDNDGSGSPADDDIGRVAERGADNRRLDGQTAGRGSGTEHPCGKGGLRDSVSVRINNDGKHSLASACGIHDGKCHRRTADDLIPRRSYRCGQCRRVADSRDKTLLTLLGLAWRSIAAAAAAGA